MTGIVHLFEVVQVAGLVDPGLRWTGIYATMAGAEDALRHTVSRLEAESWHLDGGVRELISHGERSLEARLTKGDRAVEATAGTWFVLGDPPSGGGVAREVLS